MFKYFIFDLDNTLFNYDYAYQCGINKIIKEFDIDIQLLKNEKVLFHKTCKNYAFSHNKFIQLKKYCEKNKLDNVNKIYEIFFKEFLDNCKLYDGVLKFIKLLKDNNSFLYILTNNLCQVQYQVLEKLGILNFFDKIYTSEEYNIEKPNSNLLKLVLYEIECKKSEVVFIGDSWENDIEMSIDNNIFAFYYSNSQKILKEYLVFDNYNYLINIFEEYYDEIKKLVKISNYCGQRWDLVQAGGGNSSVKIGDIMYIKASGCNLTEIDLHKNYVGLNFNLILNEIKKIKNDDKKERENIAKNITEKYHYFGKAYKGSIETTMHCLTKKYTIHLHPVQLLKILVRKDCEMILRNIFDKYLLIDYETPGIDVCLNLLKKYNNEEIIFLKNHGLVVSSNNFNDLIIKIEEIINIAENYFKINYNHLKKVNEISEKFTEICNKKMVCYLSKIKKIKNQVSFPDKLIYCGQNYINDLNKIKEYIEEYQEYPVFLKENGHIYIISTSLKRCKEIEDVMNVALELSDEEFLKKEEIKYLNNWDAEKYRKNI